MHRAFWFNTDAGAYWSVLDDEDYSVVELADRFLQFMRFARGCRRRLKTDPVSTPEF
jgi:hypothetical protein